VISIYFKNKFFLFTCSVIGVILISISIVKIGGTFTKIENTNELYVSSIVPFYWMITLIGGIIMITLTYVSWRKYKGQKQQKKRDVNN